ncbi:MAG: hypothetical protein BWY40_01099 [bacterium ADurb.Bin270]|nr:MAG: hypothetical protein BWY40_01099 [bacterium ADurb.Bin270]
MKKIAFIAMFWIVAFILPCTGLMAADPIPPELRGAADMRSQMEDAIRAASVASSAITGKRVPDIAPAKTPEKEMERRRKLINDARADFDSGVASARAPVGHEEMESADRRSRGVAIRCPASSVRSCATMDLEANALPEGTPLF